MRGTGSHDLILDIQRALAAHDKGRARRLAIQLSDNYPDLAESWLWRSQLTDDRKEALAFATCAATIDPRVGRNAMQWVEERSKGKKSGGRTPTPTAPDSTPLYQTAPPPKATVWVRQLVMAGVGFGVVVIAFVLWQSDLTASAASQPRPLVANAQAMAGDATGQLVPLAAYTPPATWTPSPTATVTPILPTGTPLPSATPLPPTPVVDDAIALGGRGAIPNLQIPSTATPLPTRGATGNFLYPLWPDRYEPARYTVQPGDNLAGIAQRVGLEPLTLLWSNDQGGQNPNLLTIGQELWIPPLDGVLHISQGGDTIQKLADMYKVETDVILWFQGNDLRDTDGTLAPGQPIMVPGGTKPLEERPPAPSAPAERGGASYFGWPTTGVISQSFSGYHNGIDIANASKTPIFAAQSGEVIYADWENSGYGYMILIDHHNGWRTRYAHLSGMYPAVGDWVERGDLIALMGSTGRSTGPHLHFEIIARGYRYNPMTYLPE